MPPEHKQSRLRSVLMRCVEDPSKPGEEYLVARVQIDCQACGGMIEYNVMGHHIPAFIKALQKAVDTYPDLCKETVTEMPPGTNLIVPPGGRMM